MDPWFSSTTMLQNRYGHYMILLGGKKRYGQVYNAEYT